MTALHTAGLPELGEFSLTRVDPGRDAELIHSWVVLPRNRFWGMGEHTLDEVREVYAFVDSLPTHHAYLIRLDGEPVGIFQTYQPEHDPVGELYPVRTGDVGMHLLLCPSRRPPAGFTAAVGAALLRHLFADPATRRVVVEPDERNDAALNRLRKQGFTLGERIDLGHKRAQLAFLSREYYAAHY